MIKVSELSIGSSALRKKFWLETLNLPLQWQDFDQEILNHPQSLLKNSDTDGILVGVEFSSQFFAHSTKKPAEVIEAGMMDALIREQKNIWLRCYLRQALRKLIFERTPQLDTHASVYIAGSGVLAKMSAVVAVQMGFRKIVVTSPDREEAMATFAGMQKLFFDLEIKVLAEAELTLQPNNGSLLLNTLTAETGGTIFEELTFLNFLKKEGLVVDLCFSNEEVVPNTLIEEAEHVGIKIISGPGVWGLRDYLFLQSLLQSELKLSQTQYLQAWETLFQKPS